MAYYYMDTDGGSDANAGTSWGLAKLTLEGLLAVMAAGDTGFVQGLATDTAAAIRTFTSAGTVNNPCIVIAVADGTTNTGTSVVPADLASTRVAISNSGAGSDLSFNGYCSYQGFHFTTVDRFSNTAGRPLFRDCKITYANRLESSTGIGYDFEDCELEPTTINSHLTPATNAVWSITGGSFTFTAAPDIVRQSGVGIITMNGVDISGLTSSILQANGGTGIQIRLRNCKTAASVTLSDTQIDTPISCVELIASDNSASVTDTSSIQDYQYTCAYGDIDLETTIVRTGGADDGASGAFAYAMTPHASATLESSQAALVSPWLATWVSAGSATATVYICNDSASTDYNEDEVWCEFFHPDNGDTAQHDHTFNPADSRLLDSTTAVTDDTTSTWGTGGNNAQKFTATINPGFEGEVYARVYLAKRQATPDTLYLDPKIEIV